MKTIINFAIERNSEHTITYMIIFLYVYLFVTSNQVDQ